MVVTRRTPAPPIPTSRTNSSQPLPRVKNRPNYESGNASSPLAQSAAADDLNGVAEGQSQGTQIDPKKAKSKGRGKHKKKASKGNSGGFLELLTRAFLLFFTIYTLSVCPTDEHLRSPVCRGLHEYRRLILEPYLLPRVHAALAHPAVAPYVDRAKPYADRFVATAKPIALRTQQEWNARVVPQWNKRVVPQWNKHAVPVWNKYAVPQIQRVELFLDPYISTVTSQYEHRIGPHLRVAVYNLQKWRAQAQPYVVLAAQHTYSGCQKAKPYAIPVLQRLQIILAEFVELLAAQRRQYVDPHLKRIWERVVELSGGKPTVTASPEVKLDTKTSVLLKAASVASSLVSTSNLPSSSLPPKAADQSSAISPSVLQDSTIPVSVTITTGSDDLPSLSEESPSETVPAATQTAQSASSVVSAVLTVADEIASSAEVASAASSLSVSLVSSSLTADVAPSATTLVGESDTDPVISTAASLASTASSLTEDASSVLSGASETLVETVAEAAATAPAVTDEARSAAVSATSAVSETVSRAIPAPTKAVEEDDIDMDAFYAELGLDSGGGPTGSAAEFVAQPEETESEEEKAEKRRLKEIETAQKRADITGRHTKWERELDEAMADGRKTLRKQLVAIRKAAVIDLKESKEIRKEVELLVEEAEKYLKGAEKYLKNLKREARRPEEKSTMWERVIEKVDSRFEERVSQTETVVNGWFNGVLNSELYEVKKLAESVRDVADRAQADLGLDYAWLDDVTYQDWQRYHDLVRKSDNYTQLLLTIQNGTHPSPPINPVLPALADLEAEVQDVVIGFETRLRRVKRNGERIFGATQGSAEVTDDEESDTSADETVSTLPVEQDGKKTAGVDDSIPDIHHVVIGRSKEEVVAALNRAAEVDPQATSIPEDKSKGAEEVVESLVSEVEHEAAVTAKHHEEL